MHIERDPSFFRMIVVLLALTIAASFAALAAQGPVQVIDAADMPTVGAACPTGYPAALMNRDTGSMVSCVSSLWTAVGSTGGGADLSAYADSGTGTTADPWVITDTGWDQVKGGAILAGAGVYEVAHGAELDVTADTVVLCQTATFSLPPEIREVSTAMFLVAGAATGVQFHGCTFSPGITPEGTGPCPGGEVAAGDTATGTSYFTVGTADTTASPTVVWDGCHFETHRIHAAQTGVAISWYVGGSLTMRDVTSDIQNALVRGTYQSNVAGNTYDAILIDNFEYLGKAYDNTTCGKTDVVFGWDGDQGAGNDFVADSVVITNSVIRNTDAFAAFKVDGSNVLVSGNSMEGEFFDSFFKWQPQNAAASNFVTVTNNTCYDNEAGTTSQGCEIQIDSTSHVTVASNRWRSSGGGAAFIFMSNDDYVDVYDNYIDSRSATGAEITGIRFGGTFDNARVYGNTFIDGDVLLDLYTGGTYSNIAVYNNTHIASSNNNQLEYIIDTQASGCTNCTAYNNRAVGDDETSGSWTDDLTAWALYWNNTWEATPTGLTSGIPPQLTVDWGAMSDYVFAPFGPSSVSGAVALRDDGTGVFTVQQVDAVGVPRTSQEATTQDPDASDAGPSFTFADPTNGYGMDYTTFAVASPLSTNVANTSWTFSGGSTTDWYLHVAVGFEDACTSNAGEQIEILTCTAGASCVIQTPPTTGNFTTLETHTVGDTISPMVGAVIHTYADLGSFDSTDLAVEVRYTHNSSPTGSRCKGRVYGVQIQDTPFNVEFPTPVDGDIEFEGATQDTYETTLTVTDPTADNTITFPDSTGTVAMTGGCTGVITTQIVPTGYTGPGAEADYFVFGWTSTAGTQAASDRWVTPLAMKMVGICVEVSTAGAANSQRSWTIMKNGGTTSVSVSVETETEACNASSVSFAVGDNVSIQSSADDSLGGTPANPTYAMITVCTAD